MIRKNQALALIMTIAKCCSDTTEYSFDILIRNTIDKHNAIVGGGNARK